MGRKKTPVTVPDDEDMEKFTIPGGDTEEDEEDASSTGTVISEREERLRRYDAETREGIDERMEFLLKLEAILEDKKEEYKEAKHEWEKADQELKDWIRSRKEERHQPRLFG